MVETTISALAGTLCLIDYLACRFTYHRREEWLKLIRQGQVLLNDAIPLTADVQVTSGDRLRYIPLRRPEPPATMTAPVIQEDDHLLVIDKPASLPCHPGGRYFKHTLWWLLRQQNSAAKLHFVNRLDRETSGIVVIAKTSEAAGYCQTQFAAFSVDKYYFVIVEGAFPETLHAHGWIEQDTASQVRKKLRFVPVHQAMPASEDGTRKSCETMFQRLRTQNGMSLIAARPKTGRTHQIRATLCSLGFPVVGDKIYGVDDTIFLRFIEGGLSANDHKALRINRQALHAAHLTMKHPGTTTAVCYGAELPRELSSLVGPACTSSELPERFLKEHSCGIKDVEITINEAWDHETSGI